MALRFFKKSFPQNKTFFSVTPNKDVNEKNITIKETSETVEENIVTKKNKKGKKNETMNTVDKIKQVEDTLVSMEPSVKVVKSDKGLIERTESSKIILTEDNRQLLVD